MTKAIELSQLGSVLGVDQSTGSVGLGTNNPDVRLDVRGPTQIKHSNTNTSGLVSGLVLRQGSATNNNRISLVFNSLDNFIIAGVNGVIENHAGQATNTQGRLEFHTRLLGNSAPTERLRITSGGIVLINDTNVSTNRADAPLQIETGGNGNALNLRTRSSDNIYSYLNFQNNAGSQTAAHIYLQRNASTNAGTLFFGTAATSANTPTERLCITSSGNVGVGTNNPAAKLDINGDVFPTTDATHDLGSASKRWANIYSADLQLSNEGSANDIDGTWGTYTIQEGEEELFLINRRSGKKFKFVLEEVK